MNNDSDNDERRERLRGIVQRVQVGDEDEGVEALSEMMDLMREEGRHSVGQAMTNVGAQVRNQAAAERFANRFPVLRGDNDLTDTALGVVRDEVGADLKVAGATEKDIAAIGDIAKLGELHAHARAVGHKLRSPEDVLGAAATRLTSQYNIHEGQEGVRRAATARHFNATRIARGFAPVDSIGPQTKPQREAADPARDKARAALSAARQARGFPPLD
jgi:hypothetical protein